MLMSQVSRRDEGEEKGAKVKKGEHMAYAQSSCIAYPASCSSFVCENGARADT